MKDYDGLQNAVFDLLSELRIDEKCLRTMANGYSPDYPGVTDVVESNPNCKIQLSQVVAAKLLTTLDI